jgi:hypothetical protein
VQGDLGLLPLADEAGLPHARAHDERGAHELGPRAGELVAMSEPIDRPTRNTGGAHTASISAAQSRACSAIGHGGGPSVVVAPTPRAS